MSYAPAMPTKSTRPGVQLTQELGGPRRGRNRTEARHPDERAARTEPALVLEPMQLEGGGDEHQGRGAERGAGRGHCGHGPSFRIGTPGLQAPPALGRSNRAAGTVPRTPRGGGKAAGRGRA